jgi:hypothetical protein
MRAEELTAKAKTVSDEADIAQARKEELWHQAMKSGQSADKTSDEGYMKATEAAGRNPSLIYPISNCSNDRINTSLVTRC